MTQDTLDKRVMDFIFDLIEQIGHWREVINRNLGLFGFHCARTSGEGPG